MPFPEEEQPGPAAEHAPEPRLLTRPDHSQAHRTAPASPDGALNYRRKLPRKRRPHRERRLARRLREAHRLRVWVSSSLLVLALVTAAFVGTVLHLRHAAAAALPQLDGTLAVSGLTAPVTVVRDAQGVPSIHAVNLPDLLFAQGYVTAGDRLWQMDLLRRHAAGELAEVLGSALVPHDRRQRYLQLRAAADRAVAQLPADQMAQLQAYARGVNAYIETHMDRLPLEFRLLAYKPARWTPRDSLLVSLAMAEDLSMEFPEKMDREALSARLPPSLVGDLYPVGSWRDRPPAAQGRDITAPHVVEQIPLDPSQSQLQLPFGAAPADLIATSRALAGTDRCQGCRSGSNNWAVSGAHTASGAPLVANDMHLSLGIPDIWYEASLHADAAGDGGASQPMDVTGFTLPGVPFVIVGRNRAVAWSFTNLGADVQDVRVEHLRGSGDATEFERGDGSWAPVLHREEKIRVRGGRDVSLDILTTEHPNGGGVMQTPIISPLYRGETRALSLAWTVYDPAAVTSPFLGVNTAHDGASLVASLAQFGAPALNLVWASTDGHIGYHAIGLVPVRGPAVQYPRDTAPAPPVENGAPLPAEGDEPGPEAFVDSGPHLLLTAFERRPRRRLAPLRRPVPTRRPVRRRHPDVQAPAVQAAAVQPADTVAVTPPAVNYTVGSPISPVPVDAMDASQVWSGYVPYDALPVVTDPSNGFLATANARITPDNYPYALTLDWADSFRVERIVHLLKGRQRLTPDDMLHMEMDVHSDVDQGLAERLAYAIDHASLQAMRGDSRRLHAAANLLRTWDGEVRADSPAAAIVAAVRSRLWPALLIPPLVAHNGITPLQAVSLADLYNWGEQTSALELLLGNEPARWLPKPFRNWNDFLASTMATALRQAGAPSDLARWQYGQLHRVELEHPLFGEHPLVSRLLGIPGTTGAQPAPGDGTTIDAIGLHFGPSERFIADLSSPDAALGNITSGESADTASPWYLNQFRAWLAGRSFPLPVEGTGAQHKLVLTP